MALPNSNISTTLVANTLGTNSRDVGTLCTHQAINKWSKWKPVRLNTNGSGITEQQRKRVKYGLSRGSFGTGALYDKPNSGSGYRLGDFRGYNHDALPPVKVEIISVNGNSNKPFRVTRYNNNIIEFRLIPGEIDPKDIHEETDRIKATVNGAFGGLSWVGENDIGNATSYERDADDVFSAIYLDSIFEQSVLCNYIPRVQYMQFRSGTIYDTTYWKVMDDSYMNDMILISVSDQLSISVSPFFQYNSLAQNVSGGINITNTGSKLNRFRLTARYTVNGSANKFIEGDEFDVESGNSSQFLSFEVAQFGTTNTYDIYYYLEQRQPTGWVSVKESQDFGRSIYIPFLD